jgi:hypothetical protein
MNRREKILAAITGLFVVGFLVYIVVGQLIVAPFDRREERAASLRTEISKLRRENRRRKVYAPRLRELADRSFGTNEIQVGNDLVERLKSLLNRSGLSDETLSLSPVTGSPVSGVYREIGRSGRVSGPLSNVIDFLYLVRCEPALHRLDNLVITPKQGGRADLQFKYSTLVLVRPKGFRFRTTTSAPAPREVALNAGERTRYNVIVARDLFRPYIKRPVVAAAPPPRSPPARPAPAPRRPPPAPPPAAPSGRFKIVDLSTWADQQEVVVRDTQTGQTRMYKPGAPLASGKIVMIDYRQLPRPDKPYLLSPSRVIIQIGPDYWAIELGQSLADKRRLNPEQLPDGLRAGAAGSPAPQPMAKGKASKQT